MSDELNAISFRADEKTYEKFKSISNLEFQDQGQCLAALINTYEIEKSKKLIPCRKLEIENFQTYINKLMEMYILSLEMNNDTQVRVRGEFDSLLKSKDLTISSMQTEVKNLANRRRDIVEQMSAIEKKNKALEEEIEQNKKALDDYDKTVKSKDELIDSLNSKLAELKADLDGCKKDLCELESLKKKINLVYFDNERLKAEIDKLNYEMDKQKSKSEIERDKILIEKGMNRQDEIDKYQRKIEELLLKLERKSLLENDWIYYPLSPTAYALDF